MDDTGLLRWPLKTLPISFRWLYFDKYIGEDQTYAIPYLFRGIDLQTLGQSDLAEKDRAKACELDKEFC